MTARRRRDAGRRAADDEAPPLPEPVDVVDGIPDRRAKPSRWAYVLIAAVFVAWLAFLVYSRYAAPLAEGS